MKGGVQYMAVEKKFIWNDEAGDTVYQRLSFVVRRLGELEEKCRMGI